MSLKNPNPVNPGSPKRVAIVIANPAVSATTGWPVGFWWSELTHPYYAFTEKGYEVEIFSPKGGKCEADGMSDPRDPAATPRAISSAWASSRRPKLAALVESTRAVRRIDVADFDAIVVAGGQAPMFTFEKAHGAPPKVRRVLRGRQGRGRALPRRRRPALRQATNGDHLVKGKTVTGFANVEEDFADNAVWSMGLLPRDKHLMPWRIEDELKALGANYVQAGLWRGFAIRDGNLITGQQNFSGRRPQSHLRRARRVRRASEPAGC